MRRTILLSIGVLFSCLANAQSPVYGLPSIRIISNSADVAVTGFATETVLCALKIPANTMSGTMDGALSRLDGTAVISTVGTSSADAIRLSLSSSATVIGTSIVLASGGAGRATVVGFHCSNRTASSQMCYGTENSPTNTSTANVGTPTLSIASDMFLVFSSTQTVSTDTQTCRTITAQIN